MMLDFEIHIYPPPPLSRGIAITSENPGQKYFAMHDMNITLFVSCSLFACLVEPAQYVIDACVPSIYVTCPWYVVRLVPSGSIHSFALSCLLTGAISTRALRAVHVDLIAGLLSFRMENCFRNLIFGHVRARDVLYRQDNTSKVCWVQLWCKIPRHKQAKLRKLAKPYGGHALWKM